MTMTIRPTFPPGIYVALGVFTAGAIFAGLWIMLPVMALLAWLFWRAYKHTSMTAANGLIRYQHGRHDQVHPMGLVVACDTQARPFTTGRTTVVLTLLHGQRISLRNVKREPAVAFCEHVMRYSQMTQMNQAVAAQPDYSLNGSTALG